MFFVGLLLTFWKLICVLFFFLFLPRFVDVEGSGSKAKEKSEGKDEVLMRHTKIPKGLFFRESAVDNKIY